MAQNAREKVQALTAQLNRYRDEYYNPDTEDKGVAEIIIAKQRSGPTGKVKLAWLSNLTKFGNLEQERM